VVFTLGSAAVDAKRAACFYQVSAEAAAALGVRAVLLTGRESNRPRLVPAGCFVAEWAPHSELFARASAVVHQGGAGTLHTALSAGRPMLIVPFAHDQPDNAARTERLGVARVLYPQKYSNTRVRTALEGLLSDSAMATRAAEVAVTVRAEDGAMTAARTLVGQPWASPGPALGLAQA
jgi:UDP:flavonoid glycosyltransferase YjiC (YdhE family)